MNNIDAAQPRRRKKATQISAAAPPPTAMTTPSLPMCAAPAASPKPSRRTLDVLHCSPGGTMKRATGISEILSSVMIGCA